MDVSSRRRSPSGPLLERAVAGDREAFGSLVRQHDDRLRGLAWRLLGDRHRMDDAMQEAYLKAWRALPGFRADADFGTWLYRITYNACLDELRRGRTRPAPAADPLTGEHPAVGAAGPERHAVAADMARRALSALPDEQRVTVVLVDGEGFDTKTAARILGVAPGTVASRLSRARAAIRTAIGEDSE